MQNASVTSVGTSDDQLLDLLRHRGSMSITEMATATSVTATAVRQRLSRLAGLGLIQRDIARAGAVVPSHRYSLTDKARRQAGNNLPDLAMILWDEIRTVKDPTIRRGLLERIASAMATMYRGQITGHTVAERAESLKRLFAERRVPIEVTATIQEGAPTGEPVEGTTSLPLLTVAQCPYPELAEKDRGISAVEKMLFAKLLDGPLRLSQCRLDGHSCCQFETN